jgi:hypothetical protein
MYYSLTDECQASGVFSVPALYDQNESLNNLFLCLEQLRTQSESSSESRQIEHLKCDCVMLERRFARWEDSRSQEFKPTVAGRIHRNQRRNTTKAGYWPGRVGTYFDCYVAGVYNLFRAARLLLVSLIINLSDTLGHNDSRAKHIHIANHIIEEMVASIPYHLTDDLQSFLSKQAANVEISTPGRSLGGLLLMHPLYVASEVSFLPEEVREYMRRCLAWIGSNMGIGQARLLAKVQFDTNLQ